MDLPSAPKVHPDPPPTTTRRRSIIVTVISVLIVGEAISFLIPSLLHLGVQFPLGISEPRNMWAGIVEGLCWLFMTVSAYALFAHRAWAWRMAIASHIFALLGVLVGIFATGNSTGDDANYIFHRVILVVLIAVLVLLLTPAARAALNRSKQTLPIE